MVYPLLPLFIVGVLGSSRAQLGLIEGSAVLLVALMTAFAGFRSDRSGRRVRWIQIGYGLPVLGKAIVTVATGWPMVMGGRLFDRFGKGLRSAPRDAMIADAVDASQRGRAFGVHRALDTVGALVGVLLAAGLLWYLTGTAGLSSDGGAMSAASHDQATTYRIIFAVAAGLGLAAFALTFFLRDMPPKPAAPAGSGAAPPVHATSLRASLKHLPRSYWSAMAVLVLFSLANSADSFLLLRAGDLGYSPALVVLIYAVFNAVYAALSYPAGVLSDRLGRWGIIAVGWVIYVAVYVGFAFLPASSSWGVWPLMAFYGVYMALTDGIGKALIADHAPPAYRGTAMGIFYAATGVASLISSVLAGWVWDRWGAAPAFLIGAGFAVLALIALAIYTAAGRWTRRI